MTLNLSVGCLAYFDTFAGLVPCVVKAISGTSPNPISSVEVQFKITADRGAYRKGELLKSSSLWVVPRGAIRRRQYQSTIGHYTVNCDG